MKTRNGSSIAFFTKCATLFGIIAMLTLSGFNITSTSTLSPSSFLSSILGKSPYYQIAHADPINGQWTQLTKSPSPGDKKSSAWAYDPNHEVIILFGGIPNSGQTWVYHLDTETWERKFPPVSPPSRSVHQMTFDTENGVAVLFGGYRSGHGTELGDTWTYDYETNTWTQLATPVSPPKRHWGGLVYEPVAKKVVLFGGHENIPHAPDRMYNDLWVLDVDAKTWTQIAPSGSVPSPRQTFPIYNTDDGLIYIFGGKYEDADVRTEFYNDIWSYNLAKNTWNRVDGDSDSTSKPSDRRAKWVYDPVNNYAVLFSEDQKYTADTWIFDFDTKTWSSVTLEQKPEERLAHLIFYDEDDKRVLIYGGVDSSRNILRDMWQLKYPDKSDPVPEERCFARVSTIVGTDDDDIIVGTSEDDIISGLGGNDTIKGMGGNDLICGGTGGDTIYGGGDNDRVAGGNGDDLIYGTSGDDVLNGGSGNDRLYGGMGIDSADGGTGTDDRCFAEEEENCER